MPNVYRPRLGAKSLHSSLKGMAEFRGSRMTDRRLKEVLIKSGDKDLRDFAYKKAGTTTASQARKIIKKFAQHVHEHEHMSFSYSAKQQGIGRLSKAGRISEIAARNMYQKTAEQEASSSAPKGPTPQELREQKMREERIRQRNIANRRMANERDERAGKQSQNAATSISDMQKRENVGKSSAGKGSHEHQTNIRMPIMSGGAPRSQVAPPVREEFPQVTHVEPLEDRTGEDAELPAPPQSDQDVNENPQNDPAEPVDDPIDVDKGLPLGE